MRDRRGVLGLPFRLAIAFLIVGLCVPPLVAAVEHFQLQTDLAEVDTEVGRIADAAARVYYAGANNSCRLDVYIDPNCTVVIGGTGGDAYAITVYSRDEEVAKTYLERPPVPLLGTAVTVNGPATLQFLCLNLDGKYGVAVSLVDRVHPVPRGGHHLRHDHAGRGLRPRVAALCRRGGHRPGRCSRRCGGPAGPFLGFGSGRDDPAGARCPA